MEKRVSMVLFLLLMAVSVLSDVADGKAKDRATLSGLDRKLKLLNKPAVKSIKSEDGDIIDCVDINKQPAFDHPALRNHKIQKDSYKTTGCFDITCAGFVQTNPVLALGIGLHPVSISGGLQSYVPIGIYQDTNIGNWWLKCGENYEAVVGYWPKELFEYLWRCASFVEWGGDVYSPNILRDRSPHTKTQMGSGSIAQTPEGSAAWIRVVRIMDTTRKLQYCYSALNHVPGNNVEPVFYFGGPGQGPQCM
ncbi:hypothetical protein EZV62_027863 [Acer yangbiense]|uniref:Neprosin PEP catalytic domain-containing protein n=1 Tax=Acer yangbiense TaxID=1000413 RepID=A0A5C7GP93_9ROSI|nr:hypothetical protein EZV62_027863 [Acer yangbiense]